MKLIHFLFRHQQSASTSTHQLISTSAFLFLTFNFLTLQTFNLSAQGVTKYGESTNTSTNFVDKNGKIVGTPALNKYGQATFACGSALTDTRDSKTYSTVLIGTQCWMAQNLNVGTSTIGATAQSNNATIQKYCYNDDEANCTTYGGLYQWAEMVQYTNGANNIASTSPVLPGNLQGICPSGWHIPTDAEWITLEESQGMCTGAGAGCSGNIGLRGTNEGGKLKETGTAHWAIETCGGTCNTSGFTALPGGGSWSGPFSSVGDAGYWWSATESGGSAWYRSLHSTEARVYRTTITKAYGFSVRCVKDDCSLTTTSNAGTDINPACGVTTATLAGNTPTVGTGAWSVVSGTAIITDASSPTSGITGLTLPGTATLRWTITNGTCPTSTDDVIISTVACPPCGIATTTMTDTRDSKVYNIVNIGTQCWMAQNLNIGTSINGATQQTDNSLIEKYCYGNDAANCTTYGGSYQWGEMVQYTNGASNIASPSPAFPANLQGICPSGWHIPTDAEWITLEEFQGMCTGAGGGCSGNIGYRGTNEGGKLKEAGTTHWASETCGGTCNTSVFTALPGGRDYGGSWVDVNSYGYWWSATESGGSSNVLYRLLNGTNAGVYRSISGKSIGYSVRCVKN